MRIAFMGKGGSGKTTLTTAFLCWLQSNYSKKNIFAFDVDINSHLYASFGSDFPQQKYLESKFSEVAMLLEPKVFSAHSIHDVCNIGSFPPSEATNFIYPGKQHPFIEQFGEKLGSIVFFSLGHYALENMPQYLCYHGLLDTYELIIHRIRDTENDIVLADTTAGIDNIGTSLFMAYDLVVFIVEPTEKSIQVFEEYQKFSQLPKGQILVVANKVRSDADIDFLYQRIGKDVLLGYCHFDKQIYRGDAGYEDFVLNHNPLFASIYGVLQAKKKDWNRYYSILYKLFEHEVKCWWQSIAPIDLLKQYPQDLGFLDAKETLGE